MDIAINTAQNVNIDCKPAGLINRIGATCIDFLAMIAIFILGTFLLKLFPHSGKQHQNLLLILAILLTFYHLIFELTLHGQSPGKILLHLRVVRLDGQKLSLWDCMLRWVLRLIDITTTMGIVAMVSIISSNRMQRLGDLAAGTIVINETPTVTLKQINSFTPPDDYQVVFPQVIMLSDKDIALIKEILREVTLNGEYKLLDPLALKVKKVTGIESKMNNLNFIQPVVSDYQYLTK